MKISKAMFAVIAGAAISSAAHGQEAVQAEKQAAIKKILPDAYGSVEVRHSTTRVMEKDEQVADAPTLQVRPTLGTTLFDGKVDTAFTFRYIKKPETSRISKSSTYNETTVAIIGNDLASLKAYGLTYVAGEDSFSTSDLGFLAEAAKAYGPLKISAYMNPVASFNSRKNALDDKNKVTAADKTPGLSLTDSDKKVEKEQPGIGNSAGISASYKIGTTGLALGTGLDFGQAWEEKLAIVEVEDGTTRRSSDGYQYRSSTMSKVNVSYKLSDKTSVVGQVRGLTRGFYAESVNKSNPDEALGYATNRFEARLSLNATLF
jgi:hypothetical protein